MDVSSEEIRAIYAWYYKRHMKIVQHRTSNRWGRRQPRWDGGTVNGQLHEPIWPMIAKSLAKHRVPAFSVIDTAFKSRARTPPNPDEICRVSEFAERWLASQCRDEKYRLKSELERFQVHGDVEFGDGPGVLLTDSDDFRPLFRYCLSLRYLLPKNCTRSFLKSAARQYVEMPDVFDQVWTRVLPRKFRQTAFEIVGIQEPE